MGLARHFGLTQEGVLAVVLLALHPSEVVQVTSVMSYWILASFSKQELSCRHIGGMQRARYSYWQIFPFQVPSHSSYVAQNLCPHVQQELLLLNSPPSTIHSEGWIVDWVDRARDFEIKDGRFL